MRSSTKKIILGRGSELWRVGLFIIWGPKLGWGCKRESSLFQTSRGWHHSVCFNSNVYGLYACGDAEACLSSFHFYLSMATLFSEKRRTVNKIYFESVYE